MLPQLLNSLGSSADKVAKTLRKAGVKGVRNTVRFLNPVVRFVQAHVNAEEFDVIPRDKLRVRYAGGKKEEIPLPKPVLTFLARFDKGAYPDLELPPQES
jgi:hypothetical protein